MGWLELWGASRDVRRGVPEAAQRGLHEAPRRGRGGLRERAGRKRAVKPRTPHRARAPLSRHVPAHITIRAAKRLPSLREQVMARAIGHVIRTMRAVRDDFRIVEFSIQSNYLHLIVEADDDKALSSAIRSFEARVSKALNHHVLRRKRGKVWGDRYFRVDLTSPKQARHALAYVLQNGQHHGVVPAGVKDPISSARWSNRYVTRAELAPETSPTTACSSCPTGRTARHPAPLGQALREARGSGPPPSPARLDPGAGKTFPHPTALARPETNDHRALSASPGWRGACVRASDVLRALLSRGAIGATAIALGACAVEDGSPTGQGEDALTALGPEAYRAYAALAIEGGLTPVAGTITVLGLRGLAVDGANHATAFGHAFDDTIVVFRADGASVLRFAASTHPFELHGVAGVPDVNGDHVADVGMIRPGVYDVAGRDRLIAGVASYAVTQGGSGRLPGWRDVDHDGILTDAERSAAEQRHDGLTDILFHQGDGPAAPAAVGCQVLPGDAIRSFISAVGGAKAKFRYVLVDVTSRDTSTLPR